MWWGVTEESVATALLKPVDLACFVGSPVKSHHPLESNQPQQVVGSQLECVRNVAAKRHGASTLHLSDAALRAISPAWRRIR